MPLFLDRLSRTYSSVIGRFPGALFLALGIPFLYWSCRGLFAYGAGIRAPQSDLLACGAGLLAGGLSVWVGTHLLRRGTPDTRLRQGEGVAAELDALCDKAKSLLDSDPATAERLLDEYFTREAAETAVRRGQLRQRAGHDLEAAVALRRELQEEVRSNTLVRKDLSVRSTEAARAGKVVQIDAAIGELNKEILQLDGTINRLKHG